MKVVGIIPARMSATRFPGKPLATLHGMPMIGHCYHRTMLAKGIDSTYVATCDDEIADYVHGIDGAVIMTSASHTRATTRTAEAMLIIESEINDKIDVVVMVQGDEPLILPETIAETLKHFDDPDVNIVNIMSCLESAEQFIDKNNVKVVVNNKSDALYFSREAIPSTWQSKENIPMYMQTGIIAFRRDALIQFNSMEETLLEQIESVDMNRVLETGGSIRMVLTDSVTIGVDTHSELKIAEKLLNSDNTMKEYLS